MIVIVMVHLRVFVLVHVVMGRSLLWNVIAARVAGRLGVRVRSARSSAGVAGRVRVGVRSAVTGSAIAAAAASLSCECVARE